MRRWRRASPATAPSAAQGWTTLEEPLEVASALAAEARPGRVVVVDCLTLWLSNLMLAGRDPGAAIAGLAGAIGELAGPVILVSNEVGTGDCARAQARPGVSRLAGAGEPGDRPGLRRRGVHRRRPSGPVEAGARP